MVPDCDVYKTCKCAVHAHDACLQVAAFYRRMGNFAAQRCQQSR